MKFEIESCVNLDPYAMNDRQAIPLRLCDLSEQQFSFLRSAFSKYGTIKEVIVLPEPNSNKCYLTFSNCVEAFHACQSLDGT